MKKKLKKTPRWLRIRATEVILVIVFAAIGVGAIFFASYTVERYELQKADAGLFSPNVIVFGMRNLDEETDITADLLALMKKEGNVAVYQPFVNNIYSVAFDGEVPVIPRITYGRYFEGGDFKNDTAVCVVGRNYYVNVRRINGIDYFPGIDGSSQYQAIGAIGYNFVSNLNTIMLFDMDGFGAKASNIFPIIVDFSDVSRSEHLRQVFTAFLESKGADVVELEVPESAFTVTGFFNMDLLNLIMLIFACFCVILSTVPLTLLWAQKRKKRVAVQRMLGFSASFTLWRMFGRLMILFHLGFLISYGVYYIIAQFGYLNLKSFFSMEMLVAYLGALVFNILIAIVPFVQTMRVEPGDALRRE